ncbi:hypothetical protein PRIPAC_83160 [Pristionchus pacificus]|uniref:Cytochrome P450 n=1 Tax=Pristionchus pacificus TaxID=54126 RepID=A0A2A6BUY8_PRIPA|nr:hypothetical protein PRIPAC_83160 [Pristionchus pacificus]|eukprot:PDM69705.1 cytochrome P450 [Pristionchus pacificus]
MTLAVALFIGAATFLLYEILKRWRNFQLRDELGLDGPKPNFFFGNFGHFFDVMRTKGIEATPEIYPNLVKRFDKTFGFYFGSYLEIVTTDPEIIKEVFILQFGNFVARKKIAINMVYPMLDGLLQVDHHGTTGVGWKEMRSSITAIFTSGKMRKMHGLFEDKLCSLIDVLKAKCKQSEGCMDIYGEYQAFTMDMIARCALGQNISCIRDRSTECYQRARHFLANITYSKSIVYRLALFFPIFKYLRRFTVFGREERILLGQLSDIVHERNVQRAKGFMPAPPDLIDLMLAENEKRVENQQNPLNHDVIVSNAWAFFIAGYETTSTTLAFATYCLAKHPEVQISLLDEIKSTFSTDEAIDYERVMKMPYLHAIFCETLRLYPPSLTFTGRRCIKKTVIGGRIRVPVGVSVVCPVHAVMWSEEHYERPREFVPERFLSSPSKPSWSPTFLPFGIGPRNCVGARFAEMEFKTVLTEVVRRFEVKLDPEHAELRTVSANVLHGPKDGVLFAKLIEREFDIIQDSG